MLMFTYLNSAYGYKFNCNTSSFDSFSINMSGISATPAAPEIEAAHSVCRS